jgi:hypothetical protein
MSTIDCKLPHQTIVDTVRTAQITPWVDRCRIAYGEVKVGVAWVKKGQFGSIETPKGRFVQRDTGRKRVQPSVMKYKNIFCLLPAKAVDSWRELCFSR